MPYFALTRLLSWLAVACSGIACTWRLWTLTHSPWWLVAAGLGGVAVGVACAAPAGVLADRPGRRRLLLLSAAAAAVVQLALAASSHPLGLLLLSLLGGALLAPFAPAFTAGLLAATSEAERPRTLGRVTSAEGAGIVAGTLLCGLLLAVHPALPFLFAALALAACAGSVLALPEGLDGAAARTPTPGVGAGWSVLRASPLLRLVLGATLFMSVSRQLAVVAEAPLVDLLQGSGATLAAVSAAWSLGMVAGGPLAGRYVRPGRELPALLVGRLAASLGMGVLAWAGAAWQPVLAYLCCGLAWALMPVAMNSLVARCCDDGVRGRLLATQGAILQVAQAGGMLAAGSVMALAGVRGSFLLAGLLGLLSLLPLVWGLTQQRFQGAL